MSDINNIGEIIRTRREVLGLSQEELAVASGYSNRSSITKIENGNIEVPISKLEKIANVLNMHLVDFFPHDNHKITHQKLWIGEIVKKRRKEMGLSSEELANLSGYSVDYIEGLEQGVTFGYPVKALEDITNTLGLNVFDMLASLPSYYYIFQDKEGISCIDTCGWDDASAFFAMSPEQYYLVGYLKDFQSNSSTCKEISALLDFSKLLTIYDVTTLSNILLSLKKLNDIGIHKATERLHELTEIERYTNSSSKQNKDNQES